MKLNPFEQGRADARNKVRQGNPFPVFTQRWALYNRGYNTFDVFSAAEQVVIPPQSEASNKV